MIFMLCCAKAPPLLSEELLEPILAAFAHQMAANVVGPYSLIQHL
jgi:hypothetical protein